MAVNPANLRWQYILEDLVRVEHDGKAKEKLNKCLDSLSRYPLVILDVDHCNLLQHFTGDIILKMKARIDQENDLMAHKSSRQNTSLDVSPIRASVQHDKHDKDEETRRQQEAEDFALAMQLSQEQEAYNFANAPSAIKEFKKPSQAFSADYASDEADVDKNTSVSSQPSPLVQNPAKTNPLAKSSKVHDISSDESFDAEDLFVAKPETKRSRLESSAKQSTNRVHTISSSDSDSEVFTKGASKTSAVSKNQSSTITTAKSKLDELFARDPVFARLNVSSGDDDDDGSGDESNLFGSAAADNSKKRKKPACKTKRTKLPKPPKVKKSREYYPKPGSGGYAILVALLQAEEDSCFKGYLTKKELCDAAQPLANESMTHTNPGAGSAQWYNGWSSSSTLIKKKLVESWSNPKKFRLTDSGRALAHKLLEKKAEARNILLSSSAASTLPNIDGENENPSSTSGFDSASWLKDVSDVNDGAPGDADQEDGLLRYCYVTDSGEDTDNQNRAEVDILDTVYYLVKCEKKLLEKSGKDFRVHKELSDGLVLAFLREDDCLEKSPVGSSDQLLSRAAPSSSTNVIINEPVIRPRNKKKSTTPKKSVTATTQDSVNLGDFCSRGLPGSWTVTKLSDLKALSTTQKELDGASPRSEFALRYGQYEIILIVDAMEVTGGSAGGKKSRKDITPEELTSLGVKFETRKLSIGDFIWIARGGGGRELVLPYIIERKRMDDLRSSIMDGRYKEQKARMSQSGIANKIYLVEEIGHAKDVTSRPAHLGFSKALDRSALDQAMSNTFVRDGFHVKITKSQKESIRFLANMTNSLMRKYAGQDLRHCPLVDVKTNKNGSRIGDLLKFNEFHENSRPDKALTTREIFSNMLICQKGLSSGMAWAITDKYPTISALKLAYKRCDNDEEREKMVAGIPYDNGKKKIPISVSRTLSWLFNERDYD